MTIGNDDLAFAELAQQVAPLIEKMNDLMRTSRISLKNQQYRIDNNHMTIVSQEKQISENKALLDGANERATAIISVAQERAKEIEKGITQRVAQINHMERETKKKLEEADKILWEAQDKKKVKA